MKAHPIAEAFPMLSSERLAELSADISARGQQHPIVLWNDLILDGRNRFAACELSDTAPVFERRDFASDAEAAAFVMSENMQRRDLDASQRAYAAAYLKPYFSVGQGKRTDLAEAAPRDAALPTVLTAQPLPNLAEVPKQMWREKVAAAKGVSHGSVASAARVIDRGIPELGASVRDGAVAVSDAAKIAKLPDAQQVDVLTKILSGEAKTSKQAIGQLRTEALAKAAEDAPATDQAVVVAGDAVDLLARVRTAHCIITDPPYGIDGHHSNFNYRGRDYADGASYALQLLRDTCERLTSVCSPDAHLYVFSGYTNAWAFKQILGEFFDVQDNPLIWKKNTHSPCDFSQRYPSSHEYIWFARVRGARRTLARMMKDVIDIPHARETSHSAEKPTALLATLIEQSTVPGEHVVDPFCGSGSTGVAALALGRTFTGIELDASWAAVARGRCSGQIARGRA